MRIRMKGHVDMPGRGSFEKDDEVDWPEKDAQPLVDAGAAKVVKGDTSERSEESPAKKPKGKS